MSGLSNKQEQRFLAIYEKYVDEVYQYLYLRTGFEKCSAEDITQEVFMDAYRNLSGFLGLCSERTWIFRIAGNKLNDFYRKQYRVKFSQVELDEETTEKLEDQSQNIEENLEKEYEREKVKACLKEIPEQYRIILCMKYLDDCNVKEIASLVNKSPKAVESILQRAKKAFRLKYATIEEVEKEGEVRW